MANLTKEQRAEKEAIERAELEAKIKAELEAEIRAEYEEKYGPLTKSMTSSNHWHWIMGPWPWENEEDC